MLNQRIRQLRQARSMSQVDLAKRLNVTKQSVSNWENDNIQPSIEMLVKLSAVFSVSTDYLLGLDSSEWRTCIHTRAGYKRNVPDGLTVRDVPFIPP